MQVNGKIAAVTGGASGMGAATARALAAAGARVALLDLNPEAAEGMASEIGGAAFQCDVSDGPSTEAAFKELGQRWGPARIIVNCAGMGLNARFVERSDNAVSENLANFRRVIDVNLVGTYNVMRVAMTAMAAIDIGAEEERGVFVNTASVAAFEGQIGQAAYTASKAGVSGLTLQAARELARYAVRVVTIAPSFVDTPMMAQVSPDILERLLSTTIFPKRLARADEYAKLVLHIVDNAMLNGEVIRMDGAVRMAAK